MPFGEGPTALEVGQLGCPAYRYRAVENSAETINIVFRTTRRAA